jgi:crossover junction endodeoxyribonuclease RusA
VITNLQDLRFLDLPWPPSTNQLYRSVQINGSPRVLLSKQARDYHALVRRLVQIHRLPAFGDMDRLEVVIHARPPDRRKRDLDNLLKSVLDALVKGGAIPDDGQIDKLAIVRGEPLKGGAITVGLANLTTGPKEAA